jgi:hypothetical protein
MTLDFEKYIVSCVSKVMKFAFLRMVYVLLEAEFACCKV